MTHRRIRVLHREVVEAEAQRLVGRVALYGCFAAVCAKGWADTMQIRLTKEDGEFSAPSGGVDQEGQPFVELDPDAVFGRVRGRTPLVWRTHAFTDEPPLSVRAFHASDWRGPLALDVCSAVAEAIVAAGFGRELDTIGPRALVREVFRVLRRGVVDSGAYLEEVLPHPPWATSEPSAVYRMFDIEAAAAGLRRVSATIPDGGRFAELADLPRFVDANSLLLPELDIWARVDHAMLSTSCEHVRAVGIGAWLRELLGLPTGVVPDVPVWAELRGRGGGEAPANRVLKAWAATRDPLSHLAGAEARVADQRASSLEAAFFDLLPAQHSLDVAGVLTRQGASAPSSRTYTPLEDAPAQVTMDKKVRVASRLVGTAYRMARASGLVAEDWEAPQDELLDNAVKGVHSGVWRQRVPVEDVGPVRFSPDDWEGPIALAVVGAVAAQASQDGAACEFTVLRELRRRLVSSGAYLSGAPVRPAREPLAGALLDLSASLDRVIGLGREPRHLRSLVAWRRAVLQFRSGLVDQYRAPAASVP